jgi:5S rRNA maturation endonuclease (ribonuclease M5)
VRFFPDFDVKGSRIWDILKVYLNGISYEEIEVEILKDMEIQNDLDIIVS